MSNPFSQVASGWRRFWFEPQPTSTLALFRIGFGLVATLWTASLAPQLADFFGAGAAIPDRLGGGPGVWSLLTITGNNVPVAVVLWLATLAAAIGVTVGYQTRLASVILFVGVLTITRHIPYASNTGDGLIRVLAFYLMFAPAGASLSIDRWRTDRERFWESPERAPWALRLMQIQLSFVYLTTVWDKIQGDTWRNGTATSYAMRLLEVQRAPTPAFVTDSMALTQLMTFGTLALEVALGVLVWNRAARPWVLTLGVLLHLSIEISIVVGFFSLTMLALYLVFVPPERASELIEGVRARVVRRTDLASRAPKVTPEGVSVPHQGQVAPTVSEM